MELKQLSHILEKVKAMPKTKPSKDPKRYFQLRMEIHTFDDTFCFTPQYDQDVILDKKVNFAILTERNAKPSTPEEDIYIPMDTITYAKVYYFDTF